jgi:hypothetical protein
MLQSMVQQDCNMKKFGIVPHQFCKCLKLLKIDRTVWVESWVNVQYPQHETGKNAAAMLQHLRHGLLHHCCTIAARRASATAPGKSRLRCLFKGLGGK